MKKNSGRTVWLELLPQQKFHDDLRNRILDVTRHASEFALFVYRRGGTMRIVARCPERSQGIFRTIDGMSATESPAPPFGEMRARCLVLKNRSSMIPLVDLKSVTRSNMYQRIWALKHDSMMAFFVSNRTRQAVSSIDAKIRALEAAGRSGTLSVRKRAELAAAIERRDGHRGFYSCCAIFAVYHGSGTIPGGVADAEEGLEMLVSGTLQNSFSHRMATRPVDLEPVKRGFLREFAYRLRGGIALDPLTFVPRKSSPASMLLTENEIAFFISLPLEYDIQTINFQMGPTPTFVHGPVHDLEETDLSIQKKDDRAETSRGNAG